MTTYGISAARGAPLCEASTTPGDVAGSSFADVLAALDEERSSEAIMPAATQAAEALAHAPKVCLDTTRGKRELDLDDYFTPLSGANFDDENSLPPLLFPTADNIARLSAHASEKLHRLLTAADIPAAPAKITYGTDGQMQLPCDYAYADEFRAALKANPALERELSTVNALASHYAGMQESLPFLQAYAAATTRAQINRVVEQFSYLFSGTRAYAKIELTFSASGALTPTINGQPLEVESA